MILGDSLERKSVFDDLPMPDDDDSDDDPDCPWCGGDGIALLSECPELWGEDCFMEEDRGVTCPQCRGTGLAKNCEVL